MLWQRFSSMWDKLTGLAIKIKAPCYGREEVMSNQIGPEEKP